ncbi:tachykinin-like peptides receptor 99D isoform X2 [Leptinotarsa decemlineata]|uniref:tachykinin-like peptides receptor 99D isoform X2 n=1 Tax=Leptinotarsa decemlineata TaxID=7539 RepID=UPI003D3085EC
MIQTPTSQSIENTGQYCGSIKLFSLSKNFRNEYQHSTGKSKCYETSKRNKVRVQFLAGLKFTLPIWRQVLWSILYAGIVLVATGGNVIVIWIILAHKKMRTVTNYFLLNLSIADTMVSICNVTFNFWYMLYAHWPFGSVYCKITQFFAALSICSSVYSLMSISIDRYIAILTPLKPRMGKTVTLIVALSTWILGTLVGMPDILYFQSNPLNGTDRIVCYMKWPDGKENASKLEIIYNICFTVITYIIPIGAMIFTYTRIGVELWGSQSIGEITERQMKNIESKRKVVKMLITIVTLFAVCWLPYHVYFLVIFYFPSLTGLQYIQEVYLFIYWLAMSNSMYNPIIYCWMNARFRTGFKKIFTCLPFVSLSPSHTFTDRTLSNSTKRTFSYNGTPERRRMPQLD